MPVKLTFRNGSSITLNKRYYSHKQLKKLCICKTVVELTLSAGNTITFFKNGLCGRIRYSRGNITATDLTLEDLHINHYGGIMITSQFNDIIINKRKRGCKPCACDCNECDCESGSSSRSRSRSRSRHGSFGSFD